MANSNLDPETIRVQEDVNRELNWKRWGPYLAERQWGTVREDYSASGDCWGYFTHDQSRSRAYRWGEDGLLGITDRQCRLCFAIALWNGKDLILKERLFGLTNPEGNHGEDVKECYYYLDSTPTHSYMKGLYKYPQAAFPYEQLLAENRRRGKADAEYELIDTGAFAQNKYFDVQVEYAKSGTDDILIRITLANRGTDSAALHVLPTIWFRNSWTSGAVDESGGEKPRLSKDANSTVIAEHSTLGKMLFSAERASGGAEPQLLFTENESNCGKLFNSPDVSAYCKDAFHRYVVDGHNECVNPANIGTKAAAHYKLEMPGGKSVTLRLRLRIASGAVAPFGEDFDKIFAQRLSEADLFYERHLSKELPDSLRLVARQAYAGLFWSKQFYYYIVKQWIEGDPNLPKPPAGREVGRNGDWKHFYARDVLSMPDKWEYPWFAAWDLGFHLVSVARLDPLMAKSQLLLLLREWYMNPNGQLPAYEFAFGDVNPPVHAWACWRVYKMTAPRGQRDRLFLERAFQKLLINFTWWVNRKDPEGKNIFAGGFLGLDNIGVFDRSRPLPTGGSLAQADGTAWMGFYCATMLAIALELAGKDAAYEDIASKFFEHFVSIVDAMNELGGSGLWDEADGFYYDQIWMDGKATPLKVRSLVGLMPVIAVENLEQSVIDSLPGFKHRMDWFLQNRKDLSRSITYMAKANTQGATNSGHFLLAIPSKKRLLRVLSYMFDENEFLSPYGIRSVSKFHKDHPYIFHTDAQEWRVDYQPGESESGIFGGNSNWRGPIWFPITFLLIEALERYHYFYGDDLKVEFPTRSGNLLTLKEIAHQLSERLVGLFLPDKTGHRPCHGGIEAYAADSNWKDLCLFHEYFHADTGRGCGASHQTGWTALVARIISGLSSGGADGTAMDPKG
jgi:Glycosyl hydrolase family 63 C-terminal domain